MAARAAKLLMPPMESPEDRWINGGIDGWINGWMYEEMGGWMDG